MRPQHVFCCCCCRVSTNANIVCWFSANNDAATWTITKWPGPRLMANSHIIYLSWAGMVINIPEAISNQQVSGKTRHHVDTVSFDGCPLCVCVCEWLEVSTIIIPYFMMLSAFSCASGAHQQMIMWLAQWRQLTNGTHTVSLSALIDYDSYMDRYSMQSRCSVCVLFVVFAITFHRYLRSTICSLFNLGATYARMKTNKMTIYVCSLVKLEFGL